MAVRSVFRGGEDSGRGDNPHESSLISWEPTYNTDTETHRQIAVIHKDTAHEQDPSNLKLNGRVYKNTRGRWGVALERPLTKEHRALFYETDWTPHEDIIANHFSSRDYRTEWRAKTAVEEMLKRHNEGRDYRTGRGPNFPKGSGKGQPY